MPDTKYCLVDVQKLIPYARNARTHSPEQIAQISASIREFGFLSPIVISEDNTTLCGHGRFYAAQKLGLKKVPCVMENHLTESQKRAYILADNKLSLNAGWDEEMLAVELAGQRKVRTGDTDSALRGHRDIAGACPQTSQNGSNFPRRNWHRVAHSHRCAGVHTAKSAKFSQYHGKS